MAAPFLPHGAALFSDGCFSEDLFLCRRYVNVPKYFDPKLLFFGSGNGPLRLCQRLMDNVVNSPNLLTVRPTISLLSMIPSVVDDLPSTMKGLQIVAFGKKYNWTQDEPEGVFFVTDYDTVRIDGLKKKKDMAVEDFLEWRNFPRDRLYGVIFQEIEPLWLSRVRSAEIFNFKKRLADVLQVKSESVFWLQTKQEALHLLSITMTKIYRWREDKESEENEKLARGEVKLTQEEKQKELLEPTTMLYGDIAEKNGIVLAEGV